jgi:competence protein ComEA
MLFACSRERSRREHTRTKEQLSGNFETAGKRRGSDLRGLLSGILARYKPQILVSAFVVLVLAGGAYYSSRVSESAPRVVYSTSLEEAQVEAQTPLLVNINTADAKELDELPGVGPSTADKIIERRRHKGAFRNVDELEEVPGIGPKTLEKIKPFATV